VVAFKSQMENVVNDYLFVHVTIHSCGVEGLREGFFSRSDEEGSIEMAPIMIEDVRHDSQRLRILSSEAAADR